MTRPNLAGPAYHRELLAAAVDFASRGWRVIPLHWRRVENDGTVVCSCWRRLRGEECRTRAKHPILDNWRETASSDPALVRAWWKVYPSAGIGLLTGGSARLVAIDVDGEIGRDSLSALEQVYGPLPETLRQTTGREGGGEHFLFIVDDDYAMDKIRNRTKMAPGIDIRAEGGLIVAAPSIHPTGAQYAWRDAKTPVASMPSWLIKIATSQKARQTALDPNAGRPSEGRLAELGWPLARRIEQAKLALAKLPEAVEKRNGSGATFNAAILIVRGFCVPVEAPNPAFDLIWSTYNPRCVPPWSSDELLHKLHDAELNSVATWGFRIEVEEVEVEPEPEAWLAAVAREASRVGSAAANEQERVPVVVPSNSTSPSWLPPEFARAEIVIVTATGVLYRLLDGKRAGLTRRRPLDWPPTAKSQAGWSALERATGIAIHPNEPPPQQLVGRVVRVEFAPSGLIAKVHADT